MSDMNAYVQQGIAMGCMLFVGAHVERGDFLSNPFQWIGLVCAIGLAFAVASDATRARS